MKDKKIVTPIIFLILGLVFVTIGSSVSSSQEGNMGILITIFGAMILLSSLYLFLKLRSTKNPVKK